MMNAKELEMIEAIIKANEETVKLLWRFETVIRTYTADWILTKAEHNLKIANKALEELKEKVE